jgi:hypothetical protein
MDDEDLYRVLPEGYAPPARDSAVELTNCERFILNRRNPETVYISPEIAICTLRSNLSSAVGLAIEALNKSCTDIGHWIQLAERQFAELPNAIYNPLAPTRAGIEASHAVRKIIGNAIESLRTLESAEAT